MVRYSFIVMDSHHLLFASLPAHPIPVVRPITRTANVVDPQGDLHRGGVRAAPSQSRRSGSPVDPRFPVAALPIALVLDARAAKAGGSRFDRLIEASWWQAARRRRLVVAHYRRAWCGGIGDGRAGVSVRPRADRVRRVGGFPAPSCLMAIGWTSRLVDAETVRLARESRQADRISADAVSLAWTTGPTNTPATRRDQANGR